MKGKVELSMEKRDILNEMKFELKKNEENLKVKQEILIQLENKRQETMVEIFKLQGSIENTKYLIDYSQKSTNVNDDNEEK